MSLNPFADVATQIEGKKVGGTETDSLGGFALHPSAAYDLKISNFFQHKYDSGAKFIVLEGVNAEGKKFKFQEVVSNKAGQVTYEKDGETFFLPGYNKFNGIAMLASRKELSGQTWEPKQVKLYNATAKGDVLTEVAVATSMIDKWITLGILEQTVNQTQKNESTGKYEPIHAGDGVPLVKDENVIDKTFDYESKKTLPEFRNKAETASFYKEWCEKYTGKKQNRVKDKNLVLKRGASGNGSGNNTNAAGTTTAAPVDNLFG
jgi:hypothetical protein